MTASEPGHSFARVDRPSAGRFKEFLHSPRTPHLLRLWDELRALEVLPQLDRWLAQRFRAEKRFGQKDRRWYSDALFASFRLGLWALAAETQWQHGGSAAWDGPAFKDLLDGRREPLSWWTPLRQLPGPRLFLWLGLRLDSPDGLSHEQPEAALLLAWQARLQSPALQVEEEWLWYGLPPYFARFAEQRGDWNQTARRTFLEQQRTRPPLWLRLNHLDKKLLLSAELQAREWVFHTDAAAIEVRGDVGIYALEAYKKGWIEIQDRASQRIGEAVPLQAGAFVWDCCAGGGGKAVQLAARLQNKGAVYVSDVRRYKLDELQERAARAQLTNISSWDWDGRKVPEFGPDLQKHGGFDAVLIDAPCSSSGTWRRSPDAKLRVTTAALQELTAIQDHLLRTVSQTLRKGGYLVYATCSWLPQENEERIATFLATHPHFKRLQQENLGCPEEDADSMFVAVLQREEL